MLFVVLGILGLDVAAEGYFVSLRWVNPPVTAFMLDNGSGNLHDYVALRYVSRYMIAATLAHEDAQLPTRFTGVDWDQWWDRVLSYFHGRKEPLRLPDPRAAQQEPAALSIARPVPQDFRRRSRRGSSSTRSPSSEFWKLYLNEAQFGPHLYGVCDAAWYYFGEPPDRMSYDDAYQLMGVLPSPVHAHRLPGGGIDMNPGTYDGRVENYLIPGARRWVPVTPGQRMAQTGAGDGDYWPGDAEPDGPDSCRTMPPDIPS